MGCPIQPQNHGRSYRTSSTLQHHSPGGCTGDCDLQLQAGRWILGWGNLVHDTTRVRFPYFVPLGTRAVRQQDYIELRHDQYAIPTINPPLTWHDMSREELMDQTPPQQTTPWSHNTLIVLRETRSGTLRDVWPKIHATQQAGNAYY
jgi:hypothetical protein